MTSRLLPCTKPWRASRFLPAMDLNILLKHGLLLLGLLLPLPNHHSHDNLPLLLCEVAEVRQLGHRGRRSGWARAAAGPHRGRHVFPVPWRTRVSVVKGAKARESRHGPGEHRRLTQALQPFHSGGAAAVGASLPITV